MQCFYSLLSIVSISWDFASFVWCNDGLIYWLIDWLYSILDCPSTDVDIVVNKGQVIGSANSLSVGDVLSCSVQDALSYRWTSINDDDRAVTYGQSLSIMQPGIFNYSCTAYVKCNTIDDEPCDRYGPPRRDGRGQREGIVICPLARFIAGSASGGIFKLLWCNNSSNIRKS